MVCGSASNLWIFVRTSRNLQRGGLESAGRASYRHCSRRGRNVAGLVKTGL